MNGTQMIATVGLVVLGGVLAYLLTACVRELIRRSRAPRPALKPYAAIGEAELLGRLLQAPGSPLYGALLVVVDEQIVALLNDAAEEGLAEVRLRHKLGGAAALQDLKAALEERIAQARETEEQKEKMKKEAGG